MEYKYKAGDRVRHIEGTTGVVLYDEYANGLVNWKGVRGHRVSDKSVLTLDTKVRRWRK